MRARGRVRSERVSGTEEEERRGGRNDEEKEGRFDPTWRPDLSIGRPHSRGLLIGLLLPLGSPLASASSKAKMATGLWPLVSQWPPPGEACARGMAPRGGRRRRWRWRWWRRWREKEKRGMCEERRGNEDETFLD